MHTDEHKQARGNKTRVRRQYGRSGRIAWGDESASCKTCRYKMTERWGDIRIPCMGTLSKVFRLYDATTTKESVQRAA